MPALAKIQQWFKAQLQRLLEQRRQNPVAFILQTTITLFLLCMALASHFRSELVCWEGFDCGSFGEWFGGGMTALAIYIGWAQYVYNENRAMELKAAELADRRAAIAIVIFAEVGMLYGDARKRFNELPSADKQGALIAWYLIQRFEELEVLKPDRSEIMELDPVLAKIVMNCVVQLRLTIAAMNQQVAFFEQLSTRAVRADDSVFELAHTGARRLLLAVMYKSASVIIELAARYPKLSSLELDEARVQIDRVYRDLKAILDQDFADSQSKSGG